MSVLPQLFIANPHGFCAGVDRAIQIVKSVLEAFGAPIFVHHEIIHNQSVLKELSTQGVIFVETLTHVPLKSVAIFNAHGVSPTVKDMAKQRQLTIFDATCPLVAKVHLEIARYSRLKHECILIGHPKHPEVLGSLGYYDYPEGGIYVIEHESMLQTLKIKNPKKLAYVTQTTLSFDDTRHLIQCLKKQFPHIQGPKKEDICYATQNRQNAVKQLAAHSELIFIIGSSHSSNSRRLLEVAQKQGKIAYLIDSEKEIQYHCLENINQIGVSAGASVPERLVQRVIQAHQKWRPYQVIEMAGEKETIVFPLPANLRSSAKTQTSPQHSE